MTEIRCVKCRRLLLKITVRSDGKSDILHLKCPKCRYEHMQTTKDDKDTIHLESLKDLQDYQILQVRRYITRPPLPMQFR
jgi:phage FluMu protein Com